MDKSKIILFNFILVPQIILASFIQTGDAYSRSSTNINTDGENVAVENNEATAILNTGDNSSPASNAVETNSNSVTTGDSTAVSEVNIINGKVEGKLEVEANGQKKEMTVDRPEGNIVATSQSKMKERSAKPSIISYWHRFLNFIFSFFKQ